MQLVRPDARPVCPGSRAVASARAVLPVLLAPIVITAGTLLAVAAGLSVTGVLIVAAAVAVGGGVIAHRTVANLLAGVLLLLARPYAPGERLRLRVPDLGVAEAELLRHGLLTTTMCTGSGVVVVPNRHLLRP